MNLELNKEIEFASNFFDDQAVARDALLGAEVDREGVQGIYSNNTASVIKFLGKLPESLSDNEKKSLQDELDKQQEYLKGGLGLVAGWLDRKFTTPEEHFDAKNWNDPLRALPSQFYITTDMEKYTFNQTIKGVELSGEFLSAIASWATGKGIDSGFQDFISVLGNNIKAGIKEGQQSIQTGHLVFSYRPIQASTGKWFFESTADYYFIKFSKNQKEISGVCFKYDSFDFNFEYMSGRKYLNWVSLSSEIHEEARKKWDRLLGVASVEDVENAENFFLTDVEPD